MASILSRWTHRLKPGWGRRDETLDMVIALVALSVAFSYPGFSGLPHTMLSVGLAFLIHELSHRLAANSLGLGAGFRAWVPGLVLTMASSVLTAGRLVVSVPGAVVVSSPHRAREGGLIALSGPLGNLALAGIALNFADTFAPTSSMVLVNLFFAFFNMLPVSVLDGRSVFRWSRGIWAIFMVGVLVTFLLSGLGV